MIISFTYIITDIFLLYNTFQFNKFKTILFHLTLELYITLKQLCGLTVIGLTEGGSLLSLSCEELELLVAGPGLTLGVHPEELTDAIVVAVGYTGWEGSTLMGTVVTMVARWDVGEVIVWEVTRGEAGVTDPWKAAKDRKWPCL